MAKKKMTLEEKLEEAIVKDVPYEVPENWICAKLGSVAEFERGITFSASEKKSEKGDNDIACLRTANIQQILECDDLIYVDKKHMKSNYKKIVKEGDILMSTANSLELVGKSVLVPKLLEEMTFGGFVLNIRSSDIINNKFVYYYLRGQYLLGGLQKIASQTTNIANINAKNLGNYFITIPPLKEQQRIVDKIESLFEKLDKAKELIEEARDDFEKRKSAILEKAFRGELTKEWRVKNNINRSNERSKLGDIVKINPKRDRLTNIDDNKECTFVPMPSVSEITGAVENPLIEKYSKVKKGYTYFKENDIIFAKITPCMENGKSAIVTNLIDGFGFGSTEFHVIRCNENVLNKFVYNLVRAKFFRDNASQHMTGAVGQRRVPKSFLEEYEIVLPTIEEQKEIVRILDKLLDEELKIDELTKLDEQIELIKKSILAKAFRGQLGTNCKEDESAIELLKEILNT